MNRKAKIVNTREEHIEKLLLDSKKDLSNFRLTTDKRDKTIQEYIRLLKVTKTKYQKLFNKNKVLKENLEKTKKEKKIIAKKKKREYKKEETDTEIKDEELEPEEPEEETEPTIYKKTKNKKRNHENTPPKND